METDKCKVVEKQLEGINKKNNGLLKLFGFDAGQAGYVSPMRRLEIKEHVRQRIKRHDERLARKEAKQAEKQSRAVKKNEK